MRIVIAVLLLTGSLLAQTKVDFSGIFLRTGTAVGKGHAAPAVPRILEVKQTSDWVEITAMQNGETAVARYRLDDKKSKPVQARWKGDNLVLKGTIKRQWSTAGPFWPLAVTENMEEKWKLSADAQQLLIRTRADIGLSDFDIYTRQPSLKAAQDAADLAAKTLQKCDRILRISDLTMENAKTRRYDEGAAIGGAWFEQITRCVFYNVVLSGDFFKNLERIEESKQMQFRKQGQSISAYTGDVVLEVQLLPWRCPTQIGTWLGNGTPLREAVQGLRFVVRWQGATPKDPGEVQSDFRYEPWRELNVSNVFYRMQIPAKDIPLTEDLEVQILSKDGERLACVKGHL
jgi:hypothetical protein